MKYYGPNEVVDIQDVDNSLHELSLSNGEKVVLSTKMLAETVKENAVSLTELRDARCFPVVSEILKIMLEWNVAIDEIDFIDQRVIMSINESMKKADEKLWGTSREGKMMHHVQNVLSPKQ